MIACLRGTLLEKSPSACVVEAGGVGYWVQVSSHTAASLPAAGQAVFLRTRQIVREDAVQLFGFGDGEELELFDLMIGVSGVGPRLALAVLSGLRPPVLRRAIREEQVGLLTSVPGIGKKTAERLVVELRDRLEALPATGSGPPAPGGGVLPRSERWNDAVAALARLGYTAAQAQEAVRRAAGAGEDQTLEHLVRGALALLGKAATTPRKERA
jgi:Holliday junction DNA helicase RuvA